MAKQIYNEGRVVGYSAYEIYLKQFYNSKQTGEPATEREWLASSIATGSSMILKVKKDTISKDLHYRDVRLPITSPKCQLCAANTIIASIFLGSGEVDEQGWVTKVTDYGVLISNTDESSPEGQLNEVGKIPVQTDEAGHLSQPLSMSVIQNYNKIVDGIILQPGNWIDNPNKPPAKDFKPDFTRVPRLRLCFAETITEEFYILLTGFTEKSIISGVSGIDSGSVSGLNTGVRDGDFLGPAVYPWASKVIFTSSNAVSYYLRIRLKAEGKNIKLTDNEDGTTSIKVSNIVSDKGISVTEPSESGEDIQLSVKISSSDTNYLSVAQTKDKTVLIPKLPIVGGTGISIKKDSLGRSIITNTLPNYQSLSTTDRLTKGNSNTTGDYQIFWGSFSSYNNDNGLYNSTGLFNTASSNLILKSAVTEENGQISTLILNITTSSRDDSVSDPTKQIAQLQARYNLHAKSSSGDPIIFTFRHSDSWIDCPKSVVCAIKFSSSYKYIDFIKNANFKDNSQITTGIWNVRYATKSQFLAKPTDPGLGSATGISHQVKCTLQRDPNHKDTLVISAVQIADGYNNDYTGAQYNRTPYSVLQGSPADVSSSLNDDYGLYMTWGNLSLSGIFTK